MLRTRFETETPSSRAWALISSSSASGIRVWRTRSLRFDARPDSAPPIARLSRLPVSPFPEARSLGFSRVMCRNPPLAVGAYSVVIQMSTVVIQKVLWVPNSLIVMESRPLIEAHPQPCDAPSGGGMGTELSAGAPSAPPAECHSPGRPRSPLDGVPTPRIRIPSGFVRGTAQRIRITLTGRTSGLLQGVGVVDGEDWHGSGGEVVPVADLKGL
jgi:hypothetical protein